MRSIRISTPLIAILYETGSDAAPLMERIVGHLAAEGIACTGFIQRDIERAGRSRCDMVLEDVRSGEQLPISEDRGPGARGCRLDEAELGRATTRTIDGLGSGAQVLVLNKFGKTETEGRGFRPLIAAAVERGIAVIVPVPWRNVEGWRQFAGEFATECELSILLSLSDADVLRAMGVTTVAAAAPDLAMSI